MVATEERILLTAITRIKAHKTAGDTKTIIDTYGKYGQIETTLLNRINSRARANGVTK